MELNAAERRRDPTYTITVITTTTCCSERQRVTGSADSVKETPTADFSLNAVQIYLRDVF